ncbi:putative ATPase [Arachidicoccus rhizosphaerae]|uniref:Replication-associated recombination protein A n=1 Tax=Arachidicoccus rhizosphaerae TaxID=551991 RepID=A0A1H4BAY2_9BACT|nr:replication-associated recombination protein A [Arachidicoccus rhizosphaerae]SEA45291.1 putative ATPase [Arachidicoccus rhizosphaerae]
MATSTTPLAERIRPTSLAGLVGQKHLTQENSILQKAIESGRVPSMILWGPPGVGKTTIAHIIAETVAAPFYELSAISSGVKDIREVLDLAKKQTGAILFIDEIHRFNKSQQDALLGAVEKGTITLIGATTENPSFEVNAALLSRCQVYNLKSLDKNDLEDLIKLSIKKDEWLSSLPIELKETEALIRISGGDGRKILNLLELTVQHLLNQGVGRQNKKEGKTKDASLQITDQAVLEVAHQKIALYDKKGEQHYDIISAFIKSMRGSDPNAAVYWLARMIEGGEDLKFIARRLVIFASEDIGNANPNALLLANTTFDAVTKIGYPESRIILSQCVTYLASCPKSNASYLAIGQAQRLVQQTGDLPVPLHLRNAPTKLMQSMGYGKEYQYAHDFDGHFAGQEYFPDELAGTKLYDPGPTPRENDLRKYLKENWKDKYKY